MIVLAHRSNCDGCVKANENSLGAIKFCLEQGWGIETDIRRAPDGRFYILHDPADLTEVNQADTFCALFRRFPAATETGHSRAEREFGFKAQTRFEEGLRSTIDWYVKMRAK